MYETNVQQGQKRLLEAIHTEVERLVSGATKLYSIRKLFVDLGWESLQSRRNTHKLLLLYKALHVIATNSLLVTCLIRPKKLLLIVVETQIISKISNLILVLLYYLIYQCVMPHFIFFYIRLDI